MANAYAPVTATIVAELEQIVGKANVVYAEPERMEDYSHDETAGVPAHMPEVVVKPAGAREISAILKLANRERIPVTPRGAGSGLSGGAVPVYGGILLSVERMNRILEIDRTNLVAVVEPGVVTNDINLAVQEYGLFYAGYPMSMEMCYIGGNVAENAGGGRAIKYGVTSRYVLGLQVVLPTGEIAELGGKRVKDVTGYDLIHLLVGSEGTLGIFTKITLRLTPLPAARVVVLVPFPDVTSAIAAVPKIITQAHVIPSSVEFMDRASIEIGYRFIEETPPVPNMEALLMLEVEAFSEEQAEAEYRAIVEVCLQSGALDAFVGDTPAKARKMWHAREVIAKALKIMTPLQSGEDLVAPTGQIPELVAELQRLSSKYDLKMPSFGHAGDGNLHVYILARPGMTEEEWQALSPKVLEELYRKVSELGGTLTGEHGVGSKRARYLPLFLDENVIALQKKVKHAFDPNNILNPGKIFP